MSVASAGNLCWGLDSWDLSDGEGFMRKVMVTFTAVTLAAMTLQASAQTQQSGAAAMHALAQNATPIETPPSGRFSVLK